jgi:hypothetical protein
LWRCLHGVLLGIAGASFGVALSLGAGWFPREYKGPLLAVAVLMMLLYAQRSWTKTWVGKSGKALLAPVLTEELVPETETATV